MVKQINKTEISKISVVKAQITKAKTHHHSHMRIWVMVYHLKMTPISNNLLVAFHITTMESIKVI